ncbi:hypothetical protein CN327_13000 [Bacillus cereus]|nr:hypothetical protein CON53_08230 [Bacillus cereus]PES74608.1 hypothetical protein CN509_22180 [Bacillus cereus]PET03916.1 hypothetical protein CN505_17245 [Bacillus cereus]PFF33695.1 hypothetical protein CN327_13000 [Bacillus cereus]PFH71633.1 hypothetical protein COI61_25300 [Bacillus cereus]
MVKTKEQLAKANCSAPEELENGLSTVLTESGDLFVQTKKGLYISALQTKSLTIHILKNSMPF